MSAICARLEARGKVGVQRGRKTAVPCLQKEPPPSRAPQSPRCPFGSPPVGAPLRFVCSRPWQTRLRSSPAQPMQKKSRPSTRLRQFACPGQPVQQKEPPVRVEPACGSSCAPVSRCRKGAARQGRTRLRQFACPGHLVPRKEKHRRIASTVLKVCTFTQIAAAYRHPYAPEPAGPVPDDRVR